MLKPNQYSTIRGEPKHKPADGYSLTAFYELLLKPTAITGAILFYLALFQKDEFWKHIRGMMELNDNDILYLTLLVLSILAGMRILQSLYLAKRDYQHLENSIWDIIIFVGVCVFFLGGGILYYVNKYGDEQTLFILVGYSALALLGVANFFSLWCCRLAKKKKY